MRVRAILLAVSVLALLPATAAANYPHVVQPGETLTSVAAVDGLNIEAIANANGISPEAQLIIGQTLWIPPRTSDTAAVPTTAATSGEQSVAESTESTESSESADSSTADTESSTSSQSETTDTSYTQTQSTAPTQPSGSEIAGAPAATLEHVSAGEIASIADANGVPAPLAEAIAWQESGWNNDEISGIGAVGVMQIVPDTWTWIDRYLTPSDPLGTTSAAENIRAGVLLLHQLLGLTDGDESLAVAGYYQGLSSVEAHGMYRDTRQYVADVLALAGRFAG